ncbi:MAG: sulfatase-like hydrolase/transferase, partial [Deltaproteobacteria bacterium]|nr:sulfatase-like hydrolase/transferase [Deltaproteobacteria bacterium]
MKNVNFNNLFLILLISSLLFFDLSCSKNGDSEKEIVKHEKTVSPKSSELTDKKSVKTLKSVDKTTTGNQAQPAGNKIVYILIDALRADRLGCYGFKENTSPAIDKLASQGVLFENVHSASPWTEPSFGTLFTGVSPTVHGAGEMLLRGSKSGETIHGVTVGGLNSALKTMPELLPDTLKKGAIINNAFVNRELG